MYVLLPIARVGSNGAPSTRFLHMTQLPRTQELNQIDLSYDEWVHTQSRAHFSILEDIGRGLARRALIAIIPTNNRL